MMTTIPTPVIERSAAIHARPTAHLLPIIIGLAVLYVPSLYDLFTGIWSSDEQMHGSIVLGRSQDSLLFEISSAT